jgi:hypothetical protein
MGGVYLYTADNAIYTADNAIGSRGVFQKWR